MIRMLTKVLSLLICMFTVDKNMSGAAFVLVDNPV